MNKTSLQSAASRWLGSSCGPHYQDERGIGHLAAGRRIWPQPAAGKLADATTEAPLQDIAVRQRNEAALGRHQGTVIRPRTPDGRFSALDEMPTAS